MFNWDYFFQVIVYKKHSLTTILLNRYFVHCIRYSYIFLLVYSLYTTEDVLNDVVCVKYGFIYSK